MMASNGGGAFSRSTENKELIIDSHQTLPHHQHYDDNNNNNKKGGGGGGVAGVVAGGTVAGAGVRNISIAERRAAKCGFNVPNMNLQPRYMMITTTTTMPSPSPTAVRSQVPYFTIPPGISPSALLDSPIMLPNAQAAQLSPTTGTFQFPSHNHQSLKLKLKLTANGDPMDVGTDHCCSIPNAQRIPQYSVLNNSRTENKPVDHEFLQHPADLQEMSIKDCNIQMISTQNHNGKERSTIENVAKQQKGAYFPKEVTKSSEDGYYWRKYGQKHVKGSEYPRSYYKCTNTNCPVRKKVERSHDGQITEIVYKGSHNHPKPLPLKRFGDTSEINNEGTVSTPGNVNVTFGSAVDGLNRTSSTSLIQTYFSDPLSRSVNGFEPVETQEFSSAFGGQDGDYQDEASPDQSISLNDEDDENDESEPKKRKRDGFSIETNISRSTREPRVVVQIESEIDILDDGYRWRKYGQKVVKGNPNPRSYYKCTSPGCPVRKHVERAANDLKSVITTYEGKHNHEVPTAASASASTKNNGSGILISDHHHHLPPNSNTMCLPSASSSTTTNHIPSRQGKQSQQSSIFNFNHDQLIMRSNMPAPAGNFFNFGSSSINYPLSFPPFHYGSVLMNGNSCIKNYQSNSNLYPISLPDYITTNPVQGSGISGNNLYYNNYAAQPPGSNQGQEIRECHTKILKPKEEKRDESDHIYDSSLSILNHGNGIM